MRTKYQISDGITSQESKGEEYVILSSIVNFIKASPDKENIVMKWSTLSDDNIATIEKNLDPFKRVHTYSNAYKKSLENALEIKRKVETISTYLFKEDDKSITNKGYDDEMLQQIINLIGVSKDISSCHLMWMSLKSTGEYDQLIAELSPNKKLFVNALYPEIKDRLEGVLNGNNI